MHAHTSEDKYKCPETRVQLGNKILPQINVQWSADTVPHSGPRAPGDEAKPSESSLCLASRSSRTSDHFRAEHLCHPLWNWRGPTWSLTHTIINGRWSEIYSGLVIKQQRWTMKTINFFKRRLLEFLEYILLSTDFSVDYEQTSVEFCQLTLPEGTIRVTFYHVPIQACAPFITAYFNSHKQFWGASIVLTIFQIGESLLRNTQWLSKVILMPIFTLVWQKLQLSFFPHYLMHSEDFSGGKKYAVL